MVKRTGRTKSAKLSQAGDRGEGSFRKTHFSGPHATRQEKRAEEAEERREAKKLRETAAANLANKAAAKEPHSFVIHSGKVGKYVLKLERDLRKIMEPNTAQKLKVMRRNNVRDFIVNGAVLGVTHMLVLTRGELSVNLRIMRIAQGPTITFRIREYCLARHVLSSQKKSVVFPGQFKTPPLVLLSGFNDETKRHLQLVQTTFQNLFPTINVDKLNLATVRRCLMVKYNAEDDTIDIRHYAIKAVPTAISKSAKKLMNNKVPDLSRYKDISEFFMDPGQLSDSAFEDDVKEVELAQDLGERGCYKGHKTQLRLYELGPRLTVDVLKVEQGIDEGEVLYHKLVTKSAKEIAELKKKAPRSKKLRERRRKDIEQRTIRRLERAEEKKRAEEEEVKAYRENAARKQAAATGQAEEADEDMRRDREIAEERERQSKRGAGGGDGQNKPAEEPRKKKIRMGKEGKMEETSRGFE